MRRECAGVSILSSVSDVFNSLQSFRTIALREVLNLTPLTEWMKL